MQYEETFSRFVSSSVICAGFMPSFNYIKLLGKGDDERSRSLNLTLTTNPFLITDLPQIIR